jgi:hypothetical protein
MELRDRSWDIGFRPSNRWRRSIGANIRFAHTLVDLLALTLVQKQTFRHMAFELGARIASPFPSFTFRALRSWAGIIRSQNALATTTPRAV